MRYALLAYGTVDAWAALTDEERAAWVADEVAFYAELADRGAVVHASGLAEADVSTTVRVRGGVASLTDGPFAPGDPQLGDVVVIEVADLDTALAFAERSPAARTGAVEVRPVLPA